MFLKVPLWAWITFLIGMAIISVVMLSPGPMFPPSLYPWKLPTFIVGGGLVYATIIGMAVQQYIKTKRPR